MKAIVNTQPGALEWKEWPAPTPGPGQVRVRTAACGICGTDLEMIAGWERTRCPAIPGHEWSGVVEAVGPGVASEWIARPVVGENVLSDGGEVGFEHAGGYGEFFVTEARCLHRLPDGFPLVHAALIEPLAVCVRGMRRLGARNASRALVLGDGVIGLLMVALLRRAGVRNVALVGGREGRLGVGISLGADASLNYHKTEHLKEDIRKNLGGDFPVIVEASGSAKALDAGLSVLARDGAVLLVGDYGKSEARFPWMKMIYGEWSLIGSNASAGAWNEAVALAVQHEIPLGDLVSHRLPAESFGEAIRLAQSSRDVIKVVMEWNRTTP